MSYKEYSDMTDKQVLVSVAQKVDGVRHDMKDIKETQSEIQETQEQFDDRLEKAEEITDTIHAGKDYTLQAILWGIILALASIVTSFTSFISWAKMKTLFGLIR